MQAGIVHSIQWCDTRDMTADGHTKGSIDRDLLLQVMQGVQSFKFEVKRYAPYRHTAAGSSLRTRQADNVRDDLETSYDEAFARARDRVAVNRAAAAHFFRGTLYPSCRP